MNLIKKNKQVSLGLRLKLLGFTFLMIIGAAVSASAISGNASVQPKPESTPPPLHTRFDFDGDGKADYSVFRPSDGYWYILQSQNGFKAVQFGLATDLLTPADFDGDGKTDIGVFRPSNGAWYYLRSSDGQFVGLQFGQDGDIPRPTDFDGDLKADINVFRPSTGSWYRLNSSDGQFVGVQFGQNGDEPQIADLDGDGKSDYTVFRRGDAFAFYWLESSTGIFKFKRISQGNAYNYIPTLGDYEGDNSTDIVYFADYGFSYIATPVGCPWIYSNIPGPKIPVSADFTGDGKVDGAIFLLNTGEWIIDRACSPRNTTRFSWGFGTDKPIPAAYNK